MKRTAALTFGLIVLTSSAAWAQGQGMKGQDMKGMGDPGQGAKAQGGSHQARGTIKKLDPSKGTVTLAHEPVKSLGWPSMTMGFVVKDKKLFEKLAVDKKVDFVFTQEGSDYVLTSVQ